MLGCIAVSNPESTISWFKMSPNDKLIALRDKRSNATLLDTALAAAAAAVNSSSLNEFEYVLVDAGNTRYQIHKYKQANQTVSYLKIRVCLVLKSYKMFFFVVML
jgi:hypothetical protein